VTADVLRDFMLGRLHGPDRQLLRDRLAVDPGARRALRRMRNNTRVLRAQLGTVQQIPSEWIRLLDEGAPNAAMSETELACERTKTWL
jgi:hypothetical protein